MTLHVGKCKILHRLKYAIAYLFPQTANILNCVPRNKIRDRINLRVIFGISAPKLAIISILFLN